MSASTKGVPSSEQCLELGRAFAEYHRSPSLELTPVEYERAKDAHAALKRRVLEDPVAAERFQVVMAEIRASQATLSKVRRARSLTQGTVAELLDMSQSEVSKLERRSDMLVSTLRRFVQATGGELHIVATYPEGSVELEVPLGGAAIDPSIESTTEAGDIPLVDGQLTQWRANLFAQLNRSPPLPPLRRVAHRWNGRDWLLQKSVDVNRPASLRNRTTPVRLLIFELWTCSDEQRAWFCYEHSGRKKPVQHWANPLDIVSVG
ncbi:MAG TPA: XRE family transcriptional regulator [Acidimicrobiales bacterium]|nr:XRE family transcriptional regulator [Acidimicrobiales bacterium]